MRLSFGDWLLTAQAGFVFLVLLVALLTSQPNVEHGGKEHVGLQPEQKELEHPVP